MSAIVYAMKCPRRGGLRVSALTDVPWHRFGSLVKRPVGVSIAFWVQKFSELHTLLPDAASCFLDSLINLLLYQGIAVLSNKWKGQDKTWSAMAKLDEMVFA